MTLRGRLFVGAGALVVATGLVLGLHDLTKIGLLLVLLPGLAVLLARRELDLDITRVVHPTRVTTDAHADVTVRVRNDGRLPTPLLRGEEGLAYALGDRPHLLVPRLDGGESRPDLLEIYRGAPYGINIGSVVMENDFGNPDKYKEEVQKVVMGVHSVGTAALGLIPGVGPIIAGIAGPALGSLMPGIGGAISDWLDFGDDRIGSAVNTVSARQWKQELLERTSLTEDEIGEYSGARKEIRPVTIATYQVLTLRRKGVYPHLELLDARDWGLIVYDEVHLLPAPIFRMTADLQARRRLGLTATLVREDGREGDVFSLIGPKRYDAPWKELEMAGYIATAECIEVRVDMDAEERMLYATAQPRDRYRIAAQAAAKLRAVDKILARHPQQALIIGGYVDQLKELGAHLDAPVIDGSTSTAKRERLFQQFRDGSLPVLVVSKVANFSIDLPEAALAIQVSGTFGSRQEEAQRLGRLLRPKETEALFYTLVTRDSLDADYTMHRQRFLAEQGYAYRLIDALDLEQ